MLAAALTPAAADAKRSTCRPAGSEILAESRTGRVYARDGDQRRAVACLFRTGARTRLAPSGLDPEVSGPFAIAGRFAAYHWGACEVSGSSGCSYVVDVVDIPTGRIVRSDWTDGGAPECHARTASNTDCGEGIVAALVLKRNGSVAWTTCDGNPGDGCVEDPARPARVMRADGRGTRVLDLDRRVDPYSLRLTASRRAVTWTRGGERRSASLR